MRVTKIKSEVIRLYGGRVEELSLKPAKTENTQGRRRGFKRY